MKFFGLFTAALFAASPAMIAPVEAGQIVHTSYSYYTVSGKSLPEIYRSMVSAGPSAGGVRAYGVTTVSPGRSMSVASCNAAGKYKLAIDLIIRLPRAASGASLGPGDAAQWGRFAGFVKTHEEKHRSLWLQCAAAFERNFAAVRGDDCAASHARAMKLWSRMVAACMPRQNAFDASQRSVLNAQPFVKYASR